MQTIHAAAEDIARAASPALTCWRNAWTHRPIRGARPGLGAGRPAMARGRRRSSGTKSCSAAMARAAARHSARHQGHLRRLRLADRGGLEAVGEQHRPAGCDVVRQLREAGAVFLGKTVTTQYASFDPPVTRNPWNLERTPGGSSSGRAAALACGMCLGALGSQTGGSITRPASYCGVAGLKPTFGRVSVEWRRAAGTIDGSSGADGPLCTRPGDLVRPHGRKLAKHQGPVSLLRETPADAGAGLARGVVMSLASPIMSERFRTG